MRWSQIRKSFENQNVNQIIAVEGKNFTLQSIEKAMGLRDIPKDDIEYEAQDLYDFLSSFPKNIVLYRAVHVKKGEKINLSSAGIHWTHSIEKAKEYASNNLKKPWVIFTGETTDSNIDWGQTIAQNISWPHEEELQVINQKLIKKIKIVHASNDSFDEERQPKLNKPMRGDVKKYKVYVKDPDTGNIKKVNFGDPNMEIKRDDPERRKSFRARHKCDTAKDKTSPRYWSCKFWSKKPVSKIMGEDIEFSEVTAEGVASLKSQKVTENEVANSESGTLTLWHGGNLDSNADMVAHKGGRWEHGPGLYLTTHYDTAKKYAKGSRKLYKVVVKKGTEISSVKLPEADALEFVNTWVIGSKRKTVADRLGKWIKDGQVPADIFLNIMVNEEALRPASTEKLRSFLVEHGVDYVIVDNAFGWNERMLVLFNMAKIVSKKAVGSEKIDVFDLPTDWRSESKTMSSKLIEELESEVAKNTMVRLYRGLTQKIDNNYDLSKTDARHGYSTWTDNLELAKQYAGKDGYVYYLDLPKSEMGKSYIDENPDSENYGDRVLFYPGKEVGLNNIKGREFLVYTFHDLYDPGMVKRVQSENMRTEDDDYHMAHEAPDRNSGSPIHDLTPAIYPEDFYGPNGVRYYGDGSSYDGESWRVLVSVRGKPNAKVRIYRAVPHEPSSEERIAELEAALKSKLKTGKFPKGFEGKSYENVSDELEKLKKEPSKPSPTYTINPGDWVTVSRRYAKEHGDANLGGKGKYQILSKLVKASDVYTNGDSIHEQGYDPQLKEGDDDLEEKTFKYGMTLRPAGPGAVESGYIKYDPDFKLIPKDPVIRHGAVEYDHELSDEQIKKWELVPIGNEGYLDRYVEKVWAKVGKYASKYLEIGDDALANQIKLFVDKFGPIHPVELEKVIEKVILKAKRMERSESIDQSKIFGLLEQISLETIQVFGINADKEDGGESCPLVTTQKKLQEFFSNTFKEKEGKNSLKIEAMRITENSLSFLKSIYATNLPSLLHHLHEKASESSSYASFRDYLNSPSVKQLEPLFSFSGKLGEVFYGRVRIDDSKLRLIVKGYVWIDTLQITGIYIFDYEKDDSYENLKKKIDSDEFLFFEEQEKTNNIKELRQIKWSRPTDKELEDEFHEGEIDSLLLPSGYPRPGEREEAFAFFKKNLRGPVELDPKALDSENAWRFRFPDYETFKKQVTSYGGPKDPDSIVKRIQAGESLPMPVVVAMADGRLVLAGGATRTAIASLAGQKIQAMVLDEKKALERKIEKAKRSIEKYISQSKNPDIEKINAEVEELSTTLSTDELRRWEHDNAGFDGMHLGMHWAHIREWERKIAGEKIESRLKEKQPTESISQTDNARLLEQIKLETIQVFGTNADKEEGGLRGGESSWPNTFHSNRCLTSLQQREPRLSTPILWTRNSKKEFLESMDKKFTMESLQGFAKSLEWNPRNWSRRVHDYFKNNPTYLSKGKKISSDSTRKTFLSLPQDLSLDQIEPVRFDPSTGKSGYFRVRTDDSIYRVIIYGFIQYDILWIEYYTILNYENDQSYKEFMDKVDAGDVELHEDNSMEDVSKETWYHGAGEKYEVLKPGDGIDGPGIYLTKNKQRAVMYAKKDKEGNKRPNIHVHEVKVKIDPEKVWYGDKVYDLRDYTDAPWLQDWIKEYGEKAAFKNGENARLMLGWDDNEELKKNGFQAYLHGDDLIVLDPKIIVSLDGKVPVNESIFEADWAHEIGNIRAELGEIEEIYKDFNHIYSRFKGIQDIFPIPLQTKLLNGLQKAYRLLNGAESLFRDITHTGKSPRRNPIVHSAPALEPTKELERISMDIAKLSVRVRNIGQATSDFESVDIEHVRGLFEQASEILRKVFVQFERFM